MNASWLDPVFWVISTSGLGWVQAIFFLIIGFKWPNFPQVRWDWFWPVVWGGLFTALTNNAIKKIFGRERPSNFVWAEPQEGFYHNSYPSGHTAGSFGLAIAFCLIAPVHVRWKVLAIVWASLVGFSRIYRGVHWPTDVIGGIGNGLICAVLAALLWQFIRRQAASAALSSDA
jgi:undecaprenyl-diphosphatase